jgi:hypothetical protein
MSNISVAEILKMHGKDWIKSEDFVNLVSGKLKISERQAYNKIKEAWKKREILKSTLPDRTVIYGLPEFGHPSRYTKMDNVKTLDFKDAFFYQCFKKLEEISDMAVHGVIGIPEPEKALGKLRFLIARLPKPLKDKIKPKEKELLERLAQTSESEYENECYHIVRMLIDEISTLLHEEIKRK